LTSFLPVFDAFYSSIKRRLLVEQLRFFSGKNLIRKLVKVLNHFENGCPHYETLWIFIWTAGWGFSKRNARLTRETKNLKSSQTEIEIFIFTLTNFDHIDFDHLFWTAFVILVNYSTFFKHKKVKERLGSGSVFALGVCIGVVIGVGIGIGIRVGLGKPNLNANPNLNSNPTQNWIRHCGRVRLAINTLLVKRRGVLLRQTWGKHAPVGLVGTG